MDTKKFGGYLISAGLFALIATGYFWFSIHSPSFKALEDDARSRRAYGTDHGQTEIVMLATESANSKMLVFGSVGG
jgi:hypothetical protein